MQIPGRLPGRLGIRGGTPSFTSGGASYNYALDEMPFLSAASNAEYGARRIKRTTAPFRKQQFDANPTPGEQSLDGYWIRSQQSFHGGAGLRFSDPSGDGTEPTRFWTSKGVNVWTPGELSLLRQALPAEDTSLLDGVVDIVGIKFSGSSTSSAIAYCSATEVCFVDHTGDVYSLGWSEADTPLSITSNGTHIFVATTNGVWRVEVPSFIGEAADPWENIYDWTADGAASNAVIAWVKNRLFLGLHSDLYELSADPDTPPAVLPTFIYRSSSWNWVWTSITESTSAIYAVGNAAEQSTILKFTLDTSTATPALSGGAEACTLPGGEIAHSVFGYLGNFVGIGTSRGARIATADAQGNLTYGPLLFESDGPVVSFAGRDRFLYCNYAEADDADFKLARIDLSNEIAPGRYAYATDLIAMGDSSSCFRVSFFPGKDLLGFVTANEFYRESTLLESAGWLYTSRVRFSTLEPKTFRSIRVRGPLLEGSLGVSIVSESDSVTPLTVFGVGQTPGETDIVLNNATPRDFVSLKFDLANDPDLQLTGAAISGWQIKALPASPRQRLVTLPLYCYDYEKDKHGLRTGGARTAITRLIALEDRESSGSLVTFRDLDAGLSWEAFIESLEFEQSTPPPKFEGWGGIITITLRLL